MKKTLLSISAVVLFGAANILLSSWGNEIITDPHSVDPLSKSTGANAGYSGDPYNGNKDCTNCHSGTATTISGLITTDIPSSGYVPGTVYNITTSKSSPSILDFGFQTTAQNLAGVQIGTLAPLDATTQVKLLGSVIYINQTGSSNTGNGSKSWTYKWTAPVTGSGPVTFYGTFLEGDGGGTGGDKTYLSTTTISESTVGITQLTSGANINIYPTISKGSFTVDVSNGNYSIQIYNLTGEQVYSKNTITGIEKINLNVTTGLYFVNIKQDNKNTIKKIVIQ